MIYSEVLLLDGVSWQDDCRLCRLSLRRLTGSVWSQSESYSDIVCVCARTTLHSFLEVKTGLKISPQVSLSQLTSSCLLSPLSQRHLLSASHVHTNSKSEVRKGSPLLTWSPGWQGRSCRQGHQSSWGVSCGSWLHRGCFRCCCCGRYAANKIHLSLFIFLFQEAAKWAFVSFCYFSKMIRLLPGEIHLLYLGFLKDKNKNAESGVRQRLNHPNYPNDPYFIWSEFVVFLSIELV